MKYKIIQDDLFLEIDHTIQGLTILDYFSKLHLSKKTIHLFKQNKSYTLNNQYVDISTPLKKHDILKIKAFDLKGIDFIPQIYPIDIVYEDDFLLIVNKEPNMIIHPDSKEGLNTLCNYIAYYYLQTNQHIPVRYLHRLDKDTSGLIMFCKCALFQPLLDHQFANKSIQKYYYALIEGKLPHQTMSVHYPIGRDRHHKNKMIVSKTGKNAFTHFKQIKYQNHVSLIECQIETGRKHQIRVHLQSLHHPILSDPLYGHHSSKIKRLALHSYKLIFIHPVTNEKKVIAVATPPDFFIQNEPF